MSQFLFLFTFLFSQFCLSHDFDAFAKILESNLIIKNLDTGGVESSFDYQKAYDNTETSLFINKQKEVLKNYSVQNLKSKNAANAFWINSYNFFMISVILEKGFKKNNLNVNSVKDFGSFFSPYKVFQQKTHVIGGIEYSLDEIEKKTLLGDEFKKKGWKDARIHFAVNCASVGCPPLIKSIYDANNIDSLLNENIKKALKTHRHFHIKGKNLNLTHLFKWYKKDFEEHSGSVINFLEKFIDDPKLINSIKSTDNIEYIEYDWKLNRPENF